MSFPKVNPHGELRELFDNLFFVKGGVRMMPGISCSRNMTVVRDGTSLTLINSMRLNDEGLAALEALGKVEHVIRIAGFHGIDDPFYKDRYDATVWTVEGMKYSKGLSAPTAESKTYFDADEELNAESVLPIAGASLYHFQKGAVPEGLIVVDRDGGIVIAGDSLQHWHKSDEFFSFLAKPMMKMMGFMKPHNLGPGWIKSAKPNHDEVRGILDLDFDNVLPVHGDEVIGGAKELYRPAIESL